MSEELFLVTGGSGYIAMHVIDQLVKLGYRVRTTVRNLNDKNKVDPIRLVGKDAKYPIEIVEADLLDTDKWQDVVKDVTRVLHVASPLLVNEPSDPDLVIKPAVEGTLNILNASLNGSVKRVVYTSSGLAVFGNGYQDKLYSEADWPEFDKLKTTYSKSKYLAEKAAWNFVEERKINNEPCFELAVINPVLVLGPLLHTSVGTSATRFLNVFEARLPKIPDIYFATCDVRDVANAHIKAALIPEAVGHRHIVISSTSLIPMKTWADILKEEFEPKGFRIPTEVEQGEGIGKNTKVDDTRMRKVLGINPTDFKSTIIDMAYSLIKNGIVKPKP